jgi:hypothetical protein
MQRIEVKTFCEIEWSDDQIEVEGITYNYFITGENIEIDLCEEHHRQVEEEMPLAMIRKVLEQYGDKPKVQPKKKKHRKMTPQEQRDRDNIGPDGLFHCRWCEFTSDTSQGKGMHEVKRHREAFMAAGGPVKKSGWVREREQREQAEATPKPPKPVIGDQREPLYEAS